MGKETEEKISEKEKLQYFKAAVKKLANVTNMSSQEYKIVETRYKSWIYCYHAFKEVHEKLRPKEELSADDKNYLALMLSNYLASWGMYRGSSFILQYDYTIFEKVVEVIFNEKYKNLWEIDKEIKKKSDEKNKNKQYSIEGLAENIYSLGKGISDALKDEHTYTKTKSHFSYLLYNNDNNKNTNTNDNEDKLISKTLLTKIIMGTIGCYPALDKFFVEGSKVYELGMSEFKDKNIKNTLNFIIKNYDTINELSKNIKYSYEGKDDNYYPLMKILDMGYFTIGMEKEYKDFVGDIEKVNEFIRAIEENKELKPKQILIRKTIINLKSLDNPDFAFYELENELENGFEKNSKQLLKDFKKLAKSNEKLKTYLRTHMITKIKTYDSEE